MRFISLDRLSMGGKAGLTGIEMDGRILDSAPQPRVVSRVQVRRGTTNNKAEAWGLRRKYGYVSAPRMFKNLSMVNGWSRAAGRSTRTVNPANTENGGMFVSGTEEDADPRVMRTEAYKKWRGLTAPTAGAEIMFRAAELLLQSKEDSQRHDAGDGQVCRKRGRRPSSHRHDVLHGGRRAAAVWPDETF